jgi:phosphoribosylanthranilate isomerase
MRIKICGIKSERDLAMVVNAGVEAVGFITEVPVDSPRKISISEASRLISKVPVFVTSVLVIMPKNADEAIRMINEAKPTAVQIHNALPLADMRKIRETGVKIIKTILVSERADTKTLIDQINRFSGIADAVLLDTAVGGKTGGTGVSHNWELSGKLVLGASMPVILAGGLNSSNVSEAIQCVHPYAVDTASGVETNGKKDERKIIDFINKARML